MHRWSENTKQQVVSAILLLLLTSLFVSRVLFSSITVLFIITGILLYCDEWKKQGLLVKNSNLVFTFLFVLPFLSGIYSIHTGEWWGRALVKLPFLFFPFVFLFLRLEPVRIFIIHNLFIVLVTGGTVYSMSIYFLYSNEILAGYDQARTIPTLLNNDHIRFSICVIIAGMLLFVQHRQLTSRFLKFINIITGLWLFIFLHILMCKTGLLMAYLATGIFLVSHFYKKRKPIVIALLILLAVIPWVGYQTLPTFKKRVDYMLYDFSIYSKGYYQEGLSDGVRWLSIKAGLGIVQEHPLTGVGYGDVAAETNRFYDKNYMLKDYEKILPSSQYLIFAVALGIPVSIFIFWILLRPLRINRKSKNTVFLMFYIPMLASMAFEIHLESQYGVFIFCFFTLWFRKFIYPEPIS